MHWRKRKKLRRIAHHHGFTHWHQYNKFTKIINSTNSIMTKLALVAIDAINVPREMILGDVNNTKEATDHWSLTHEIFVYLYFSIFVYLLNRLLRSEKDYILAIPLVLDIFLLCLVNPAGMISYIIIILLFFIGYIFCLGHHFSFIFI